MYNRFSANPTILDAKVQHWRQFGLSCVALTVERLLYASGWSKRYNFDGYATYTERPATPGVTTYLQLFRNGIVEAVDTEMLEAGSAGKIIPSLLFEQNIIHGATRYLDLQQQLGIAPPIILMISLLDVHGYRMAATRRMFMMDERRQIERDTLIVPEVVVSDYEIDLGSTLKPALDAIWNASGWSGSPNFGENGQWEARQ
jgi:hypothetical protein